MNEWKTLKHSKEDKVCIQTAESERGLLSHLHNYSAWDTWFVPSAISLFKH